MKWMALTLIAAASVAVPGIALGQLSAQTSLLLPPYTVEPVMEVTSFVVRSVPFEPTGTVAPWGVAEDTSNGKLLFSEIRQPFTVQTRNKDLSLVGSVTFAMPAASMTGIAYDAKNDTVWGVDVNANKIHEFNKTTGVATGSVITLTTGGVTGPCTIDLNDGLGGDTMYYEDISADMIYDLDIRSGMNGTCSHLNPLGSGTYGNGLSAAYQPTYTGELWATAGTTGAGQPTHIFSGNPCFGHSYSAYVDLVQAYPQETFWQEIQHTFDPSVPDAPVWYAVGGSTNLLFELQALKGIEDCQGKDGVNVLFVNGDNAQNVSIIAGWPYHFGIQKPQAGGNGKFIIHMNAGTPVDPTLTTLPAGLGVICFPLLFPPYGSANPVSVWNSLGQTAKLGTSNYFGASIADPPSAPTFFQQSVIGDTTNLPVGSQFTLQGVILNPAASSPKNASVTNGIVITVVSQP